MIGKIRDLMNISDGIKELQNKFQNSKDTADALVTSIADLRHEIGGQKDAQAEMLRLLKDDSKAISEIKEELKREVNDFKILKSRLEQKLIERFEEELKNDLIPRFDRIEKQVRNFEELGGKVSVISQRVVALSTEIHKFSEIAQSIKKEDFELARFGAQLKSMDSEKLELMKKIDTLERLVGKMRRQ